MTGITEPVASHHADLWIYLWAPCLVGIFFIERNVTDVAYQGAVPPNPGKEASLLKAVGLLPIAVLIL